MKPLEPSAISKAHCTTATHNRPTPPLRTDPVARRPRSPWSSSSAAPGGEVRTKRDQSRRAGGKRERTPAAPDRRSSLVRWNAVVPPQTLNAPPQTLNAPLQTLNAPPFSLTYLRFLINQ